MDIKQMRSSAREKMKGFCTMCPVCNGVACAGQVPGMGGVGTGKAFHANVEALAAYRLNLRTIHEVNNPDTSCKLFGLALGTPVLGAPMTGSSYNLGGAVSEADMVKGLVTGCKQSGSVCMTGDGADPSMLEAGLIAIKEQQGHGIVIIKPRSQEEIIGRILQAEESGAVAVGVDIDGAGLVTMALKGQPVSPKSKQQLQALVQATTLPFILKGIMTADEAEIAAEIGSAAIVVSNHGGRVLDHTPGVADVLPEISERVAGKLIIMADGGVRTGSDVLKLLALGADAVLIGRPLAQAVYGGGADGVALVVSQLTKELHAAMLMTGCADISDIDERVLF